MEEVGRRREEGGRRMEEGGGSREEGESRREKIQTVHKAPLRLMQRGLLSRLSGKNEIRKREMDKYSPKLQ